MTSHPGMNYQQATQTFPTESPGMDAPFIPSAPATAGLNPGGYMHHAIHTFKSDPLPWVLVSLIQLVIALPIVLVAPLYTGAPFLIAFFGGIPFVGEPIVLFSQFLSGGDTVVATGDNFDIFVRKASLIVFTILTLATFSALRDRMALVATAGFKIRFKALFQGLTPKIILNALGAHAIVNSLILLVVYLVSRLNPPTPLYILCWIPAFFTLWAGLYALEYRMDAVSSIAASFQSITRNIGAFVLPALTAIGCAVASIPTFGLVAILTFPAIFMTLVTLFRKLAPSGL